MHTIIRHASSGTAFIRGEFEVVAQDQKITLDGLDYRVGAVSIHTAVGVREIQVVTMYPDEPTFVPNADGPFSGLSGFVAATS